MGTEFAGSGRNPEASLAAQSDQMNQLANQIYGGAYSNGLTQMQGALQESPAVAEQSLMGLNLLGNAGAQLQGQAQQMIGANQGRYDYYAQLPWINLNNFMGQVNNLAHGGTSTTTQPFYGNSKAENAIGGAATGAALGGAVAGASDGAIGGPWGMAIGAGLGLLGGYFG